MGGLRGFALRLTPAGAGSGGWCASGAGAARATRATFWRRVLRAPGVSGVAATRVKATLGAPHPMFGERRSLWAAERASVYLCPPTACGAGICDEPTSAGTVLALSQRLWAGTNAAPASAPLPCPLLVLGAGGGSGCGAVGGGGMPMLLCLCGCRFCAPALSCPRSAHVRPLACWPRLWAWRARAPQRWATAPCAGGVGAASRGPSVRGAVRAVRSPLWVEGGPARPVAATLPTRGRVPRFVPRVQRSEGRAGRPMCGESFVSRPGGLLPADLRVLLGGPCVANWVQCSPCVACYCRQPWGVFALRPMCGQSWAKQPVGACPD